MSRVASVLCLILGVGCSHAHDASVVGKESDTEVVEGGGGKNRQRDRAEDYFKALGKVQSAEEEAKLLSEFAGWLEKNGYKIRVEESKGKHVLSCPYFPPVTPWTTHSFLDINHLRLLPLLTAPESSLYAFVLQAELEQVRKAIEARESSSLGGGPLPRDTPDRIFLAESYSKEDHSWVSPPEALITEIGNDAVRSVRELKGNNPVYVLSNIHWINSHAVILDLEQIQGDSHTAVRKMKLSIKDGRWRVIAKGEYWEQDSGELDPFSRSDSGQPL